MKEVSKQYDFSKEDEIYKLWEDSGLFNPDNLKLPKDAKPYTIVLPPPNITDKLHLGHSSTIAIEDLLIRFHRMKGFRTLYLPGTDHASIATQNVVEKKLLKEKNITRHDLGKEKFLEEVWKFLRTTQKTILNQAKKMGGSFDWSREAFTLDEPRKKAVRKMFVDMYKAGAIYRGERIINWCPRCQSTLADDEVEYKESKTKLYTFKYSNDFPFAIATTRPETKLGDTAVAVNPEDKRYKKYIGKVFKVDFLGQSLEIKIVGDWKVEKNFGTGALGVTPAHSMVDWQMAKDNDLQVIKVINEDGKIKDGFGEFSGLTALEARELIVDKLKEKELLIKEEEIDNNLSHCYRCGTLIEPLLSKQWFVDVNKKLDRLGNKSLKEKALEVAKNKQIEFIPFRFTKRYTDWMSNLHDWCISRQLWFGHEIPVWYKSTSPQPSPYKGEGEEKDVYVGLEKPEGEGWVQDSDTLDTWFSSGMWTFSTLGWPTSVETSAGKPGKIIKTGDLAKFHPTQVLETGYDIITLWVSRMIMMSLFAVEEIPFEKVYLHGMVLDKFGKKMSKSKGNGIDPLDMIKKFGTDAVRLSLLIGSTPGNNLRVSEEKIESCRNFVTKLWNIFRYSISSDEEFKLVEKIEERDIKSLPDKWIVSKMQKTIQNFSEDLENFKFSMAGEKLQNFTWNDLADWYVEIHKIEKNDKVLGFILDKILKLWHPFMPFVTENIYQHFKNSELLMVAKWPENDSDLIDEKAEKTFGELQAAVVKIRTLRSSYHIEPAKIINAYAEEIENKEIIEKLARVKIISEKAEGKIIAVSSGNIKINLDIASLIDAEKESARLQKESDNLEKAIQKIEKLLENTKFVASAPKEIVAENKKRLEEYKNKLAEQKELIQNLKNL